MASSESEVESYDSDEELQIALQEGKLKPGLNVATEEKPKFINNVDGLKTALEELKNGLPWIERMEMCSGLADVPRPLQEQMKLDEEKDKLVHDDFKREMTFYRQAQAAAVEGVKRCSKFGIRTRRPDDYFAEMAKSDEHMNKVREKLLSKQSAAERSEKAKKLRELRKYGKKVQQEVLEKRHKEKRKMLEAVKKVRKGQGDKESLDFLGLEEEEKPKKKPDPAKQKNTFQANKKRLYKNEKYGFGGQKKRSKGNTKESVNDMTDFDPRKNGRMKGGKKGAKGGKAKRPGKARRQTAKNKRK